MRGNDIRKKTYKQTSRDAFPFLKKKMKYRGNRKENEKRQLSWK
jgi:hypothetical protein